MSSKYINNSAYAVSGYALSGVNSAVTIGPMGVIGGPGLTGGVNAAYTILNKGTVTGTTAGIDLKDGGRVTNSGAAALIQGYHYGVHFEDVRGAVTNSGTISATDSFQSAGIMLADGGVVNNTGAKALIAGYDGVLIEKAPGTVTNSGKIEGLNNNSVGVFLGDGGGVTNSAGALIEGSKAGVELLSGTVANNGTIVATGSFGATVGIYFADGGTVDNTGAASLIAGAMGVYTKGKSTVTNSGTIRGTGLTSSIGVDLYSGGTITNNHGALIVGERNAVLDAANGIVLNAGRIDALGTTGRGVYIAAGGGSLTNEATGLIQGYYSVLGGGGATIVNLGTIIGKQDGIDAESAVNEASGTISGKVGVELGLGTLTNFGTISSTKGATGTAVDLTSIDSVFINEAGSKTIGKVMANDGFMVLAGTKGVITGLGTAFGGFTTIQELASASWTFTGHNAVTTELAIDGVATINGAMSGAGILSNAGGTTTFAKGAALTVAIWRLQKTMVVYNVSLSYGGRFNEKAGTFKLAKDTATFTGMVSFTGGAVTGTGTLVTKGTTALAGFTVKGGAIWDVFGTVDESVGLTLGNAGGGKGTLKIEAKGVFDIGANVGIAVAAGGKGAVQNAGTLEKSDGAGISTIAPAVANTGTISVTKGTLDLMGAVTGKGTETISKGTTIQVDAAVAATQTVKFAATTGGDLILNDPAGAGLSFKGLISGFRGADKLDLRTFAFAGKPTVSFLQTGTKGTLTVTDGQHVARIALFGQYVAGGFKLANDGAGGTVITYPAAAATADLAPPHHA